MLVVCFPYSQEITCVCNTQEQVVNCFPTRIGEDTLEEKTSRVDDRMELDINDSNTEVLLATSALVAVVAFFLR